MEKVSEQFRIKETVSTLHDMMKKITEKDINAENVNAACNCVNALNSTIKTAITASKYLSSFEGGDDEY